MHLMQTHGGRHNTSYLTKYNPPVINSELIKCSLKSTLSKKWVFYVGVSPLLDMWVLSMIIKTV